MIETGCVYFSEEPSPPSTHLFPGNATVDKLEDFINNINSVLESLYIEIKKGITEDDGRPIYALVCVIKCPLVAFLETATEGSFEREEKEP